MTLEMAAALAVLAVVYIFLFIDRVHRTIISLIGAMTMLLVGKLMGFYDSLPGEAHPGLEGTALGAIDWNTLGLLFGMMVIVGILDETGLFEYIAIRIAKITRGSYWMLMLTLGWFTFFTSAFLDNVTSIIVVGSVTISISAILRINPVPLLISEAIMSGVGGMSTLIGDPPNILIGSAAQLTFVDFLFTMMPIALVAGMVTTLVFRWLFRYEISHEVEDQKGVAALDKNGLIVKPDVLIKMLIVFGGVLILFVVHHILHLLPSEVALAGASLALLWIRPDLVEVLNRTKWDALLFFAGLFVIVGGLESAGVLAWVAHSIEDLVRSNPLLALVVVLWGTAVISSLVDNIPFTMAMIPILGSLGAAGVEITPLWWAMATGVAIGGNATPIGASANVYVMSLAERKGIPIGFKGWLKVGVPAALAQLVTASLLLMGMMLTGII